MCRPLYAVGSRSLYRATDGWPIRTGGPFKPEVGLSGETEDSVIEWGSRKSGGPHLAVEMWERTTCLRTNLPRPSKEQHIAIRIGDLESAQTIVRVFKRAAE